MALTRVVALMVILFFTLLLSGAVSSKDLPHEESLVRDHNELRRSTEPSAANMNELTWDNDLAVEAKAKAKSLCPQRKLRRGSKDGVSVLLLEPTETLKDFIDLILDEWINYDYEKNHCKRGDCSMYKQLVWAQSRRLGCDVHICEGKSRNIAVCRYEPGMQGDGVPFIEGKPCSECPPGSTCRDDLCT